MKKHRGLEYTVRTKGSEIEWEVYPDGAIKAGLLFRGTITDGWGDNNNAWCALAQKFAEAAIDLHLKLKTVKKDM